MVPKGCLIQCLGREQEELTFTNLVTLPLLVLLTYLSNPHTNMARQALPSTFYRCGNSHKHCCFLLFTFSSSIGTYKQDGFFSVLILYPAALLSSLAKPNTTAMNSFGLPMKKITSFASSYYYFFFPIFISFNLKKLNFILSVLPCCLGLPIQY